MAILGTLAAHHGASSTPGPSTEAVYGAGTDIALGIAAFLYVFFALAASLHLLSTKDRRGRAEPRAKAS